MSFHDNLHSLALRAGLDPYNRDSARSVDEVEALGHISLGNNAAIGTEDGHDTGSGSVDSHLALLL